jgi:ATP-binding cassette subfamily B protein
MLLGWKYRWRCIKVLCLQSLLLLMNLGGLGLVGLSFDVLFRQVAPNAPEPSWPLGMAPPADWTPLGVIALIALSLLALAVIRGFLNYLYGVSAAKLIQAGIVVDLRSEIYAKLQRLTFRFFDANMSGSIINRVTGDVQSVRMFIDGVLIQSVIMCLSLAVCLTWMLTVHVRLTALCLITIPLVYVATSVYSRHIRPLIAKSRELSDDMILALSESVQGIHVIKGFAREAKEEEKFTSATRAVREQQQSLFWKVSCFVPGIEMLNQANIMVLLAYGGALVLGNEVKLGDLIVFMGLVQQVGTQINNLAAVANNVQQSLIGAQRVFEILDAPIEIQSPADAVRLPAARGMVRFENVTFAYNPEEPVIHDITFEAKPGQCIALLGATGSGKSSIMSLLPRFYDPVKGSVLIDGIDVRRLDLDQLRRSIGLVFQESFLFSNTIASNIAFGHPKASREQIRRAAEIAAADSFIREMPNGYDSILGEGGVNLSGGQRQRLAIARAILMDPPILILDDPTAAIDAETEHEILDAIDRVSVGRTTFIIAHRLSTLRRADLILVLDNGRIAQRGTHDQLMGEKGHYLKIAKLQLIGADELRSEAPNA